MKKTDLKGILMRRLNLCTERVLCLATILLVSVCFATQVKAQRTLTIKNANGQTAGVIDLADAAQVDFRVTKTGITLGLPVGVSFTCAGNTTANGSCDATAGATANNNGGGGGGGGGGVADADSDGVADGQDQCANTPPGEFANSVGCSPSQRDTDGDGVSDAVDQCANTTAGTNVDGTGCPVTNNNAGGAYCAGAPGNVTCSASNNMDNWWEFSADKAQKLDGNILALPFTTRASTRDGGRASFTTYEGAFIDGRSFRAWVSATPGGTPLNVNSECNTYYAQARGGVYWTQNPKYANNTRFCYLGGSARVLYLNFEACNHDSSGLNCAGARASGYRFNVRQSYRAY